MFGWSPNPTMLRRACSIDGVASSLVAMMNICTEGYRKTATRRPSFGITCWNKATALHFELSSIRKNMQDEEQMNFYKLQKGIYPSYFHAALATHMQSVSPLYTRTCCRQSDPSEIKDASIDNHD